MFRVNELLTATGGRLFCGKAGIVAHNISIDSRTIQPKDAFLAIKGPNFDGHDFIAEAVKKGASCIIKEARGGLLLKKSTPGVIVVKDTLRALADIGRFQRKKFNIPLVAVTGSNGKTTTKEMIAWVLAKRFRLLKNEGTKNNHIGLPLTLSALNNRDEMAVVEIGSNHFGEIDYLAKICQPNIGVITNIGSSHLEYLLSLEGVFKEKCDLIKNLRDPQVAILNSDDKFFRRKALAVKQKPLVFTFGIKNKADFSVSDIEDLSGELKFCINEKYKFTLMTLGYYNIYNALAAVAVARILGVSYPDIADRLANFVFPPGRLKVIRLGRIRFIDDTYNSNPLSLKQALDALAKFKMRGRRIFIMGDMMELGRRKEWFHKQAGREISRACDVFIAVGKLSGLAAKRACSLGLSRQNIFTCDLPVQAQDILFKRVFPQKEDIILVKGSRAMMMERILKV